MNGTRVLVADDQDLVRRGFRLILEAEDDLEVVAEAEDGAHAVTLALETRPDVVLLDIRMPVLDGLEAARRILQQPGQRARVLMLTTFDLDEYVYEALRIGVDEVPAGAFDVVLECSGAAPAVSSAFVAARRRGVVAQIGMMPDQPRPINLAPAIAKELTVLGVFRFKDEIDEAVRLLATTPALGAVITHVIDAGDAERAFEIAKDSAISGKVLVSTWRD